MQKVQQLLELQVKLISDGATVTNATEFTGWGDAVDAGTITLEPGLWS